MTQAEYLDLIKEKQGLTQDNHLAKILKVSTPTITNWRKGNRQFGPETAMRVAEILGINPARIAADMYAQRTSNQKLKKKWLEYANEVVPERGFEPPTYALRMRRSTD